MSGVAQWCGGGRGVVQNEIKGVGASMMMRDF